MGNNTKDTKSLKITFVSDSIVLLAGKFSLLFEYILEHTQTHTDFTYAYTHTHTY